MNSDRMTESHPITVLFAKICGTCVGCVLLIQARLSCVKPRRLRANDADL